MCIHYIIISIIVMFWTQIQAILWWNDGSDEPKTYTVFLSKPFCSCLQLKVTRMCMQIEHTWVSQ